MSQPALAPLDAVRDRARSWRLPSWRPRARAGTTQPSGPGLRAQLGKVAAFLGVRPAGWLLLAAIVIAACLGWLLGWAEWRLLAIAGAVVLLAAVLFMIGRPQYQVHLELPRQRVSVGDDAEFALWVRNPGEKRMRATRLELPIGTRTAAVEIPTLAPEATHRGTFAIPTSRRAVVAVGPATSVQGDPFGLMARESTWSDVVEVFVHPTTVSLPGRQAGFVHDLEGHATDTMSNSDMSFHALREYAPGDDRRHVHWRSTARTGKLMVKQYEETRQSRMALALDCAETSYVDADEFELAVSIAASLTLQAVREGNPLGVIAGGSPLPAATGQGFLDELCRIERHPGSIADAVAAIRSHEKSASIIVLVTGGDISVHELRRHCAEFGVDAKVIGIRVASGQEPSVRASANVSVIQVGALGDLPRTVRQVH